MFIKNKHGAVHEVPDTPEWKQRFKNDFEPDGAILCGKNGNALGSVESDKAQRERSEPEFIKAKKKR